MPFISKDDIKENLFDSLRGDPQRFRRSRQVVGRTPVGQLLGLRTSRQLGGAAMNLLWRLAAECPSAVLEANFRPQSEYERERVTELCQQPVEVYCRVPPEVAARRYTERGARPDRHRAHVMRSITADALAQFQEPFRLGPVLEVDTTAPVDVDALAAKVQSAFR
jgi:hypothetical protein